jgi:hypothetical protein
LHSPHGQNFSVKGWVYPQCEVYVYFQNWDQGQVC